MGHVRVSVRIANPNDRDHAVEVQDALVDTGATWTTLPRRIADDLQLDIVGKFRVRTAAGPQELDQSYAYIEIENKALVSHVLVSDTYSGVLIGVTTLEGMGWAVDPTSERLVDSELLLL
jgi:clan AA aspartic protease